MYKVANKAGKRMIVHPHRMEELKQKEATYIITCHDEHFFCPTHEHGCGRGFFSLFVQAINGIYFSKKMDIHCYIDFGNLTYRYSDKKFADTNFWNYYFVQQQSTDGPKVINSTFEVNPIRIWAKSYINEIHQTVISALTWQEDTRLFIQQHTEVFKNTPVLGVHIRKTDHFNELEPAPFDRYLEQVARKITRFNKLFVATDDEDVLQLFQKEYPDKLIYHKLHRSRGSLGTHSRHDISDRYMLGLEALLECYSLSLCKEVILSPSNLSYAACLFNPHLPYTLIESRQARWKRLKTLTLYYLDRWNIRKW